VPIALFTTVLLIAGCGLVYELVAGALASYLLGDSVTQFSTIIGTYLFAMGIGSWLSRYVVRGVVARFVTVEILVGVIGGFSSAILFLAFSYTNAFRPMLYGLVLLIGTLVGIEIPLLMRILKDRYEFKDVVANVLTFDYVGALGASLLFPIVLVPRVGLVRSAMLFGIVNVLVALWSTWLFRRELPRVRATRVAAVLALVLLGVGLAQAKRITTLAEEGLYADPVLLARDSPYQRIVVTAWKDDLRLHLNGHLQFSSRDEYRYHEALVHPGLARRAAQASPRSLRVLVLGGGDGLAVREVLKYDAIQSVTLVDLDATVTRLFREQQMLRTLNADALRDARVTVINEDAFRWLDAHPNQFDFVVVDFPDPSNFSVGKLYSTAFYRLLGQRVAPDGLIVVQATSPLFARRSFWSIAETLRAARWQVWPYHTYVPSFGEWGFMLAGRGAWSPPADAELPRGLRYASARTIAPMLDFSPDMAAVPAEPNTLDAQVLVRYYEEEWAKINR
jgi:spermidine synthase